MAAQRPPRRLLFGVLIADAGAAPALAVFAWANARWVLTLLSRAAALAVSPDPTRIDADTVDAATEQCECDLHPAAVSPPPRAPSPVFVGATF